MKVYVLPMLALALAACQDSGGNNTSGATPVTAPAGTSWAETTAKSEQGGFVMGNPAAPVKLVEYGALSCSHCAEFAEKSSGPLRALIEKGTVSYEFRPFLLNALDVPAFLLARCNGPAPSFALTEQMFAAQPQWLGEAQTIAPQEQAAWPTTPPEQLAPQLAQRIGLDSFAQQRGVGAQKAQQCLTDKAAIDELANITQAGGREFEITGTPTFIINGQVIRDANTWEGLEPMLREAGA